MNDMIDYAEFETLSPFEIKDELIKLARAEADKSSAMFLNAGRGNPNWIATRAREAFFLLGQFALTEAKRVFEDDPNGLAGMPARDGCYNRFVSWVERRKGDADTPGAETLLGAVDFAIEKFGFDADAFVHELTDSIIGDNYPVPDRALLHNEIVTHEYLMWAMCAGHRPAGKFDLYPVEGGTAAMCYIFKALKNAAPAQRWRHHRPRHADLHTLPGDAGPRGLRPAEGLHPGRPGGPVPVHRRGADDTGRPQGQGAVPGQPRQPVARSHWIRETIARLVNFVREKRPDLMILTDDVYGTFTPSFESLIGHLPRNTIGVYCYSKYFGCTGWRLGVIAVAQDNVFDEMIKAHPEDMQQILEKRYKAMTPTPRDIKFIDRIVADSRDVALNHTAGLSLPQQVMMTLFGLVELMDEAKNYQKACMDICERRFRSRRRRHGHRGRAARILRPLLWPHRLRVLAAEVRWAKTSWTGSRRTSIRSTLPFQLAEDHGIVLLNGSGFDAPDWSARVSFANLNDDAYLAIGRAVRAVARGYVQSYRAAKGLPVQP